MYIHLYDAYDRKEMKLKNMVTKIIYPSKNIHIYMYI